MWKWLLQYYTMHKRTVLTRESCYYFNNNPHNVCVRPASHLWCCLGGETAGFSALVGLLPILWAPGWTPSIWEVQPGGTTRSKDDSPSPTGFLCDFWAQFFVFLFLFLFCFFLIELKAIIWRCAFGSCIQILPQMHWPRLSRLSCSLKELVGLWSKILSIATFPTFKQDLRPLNSRSPHRSLFYFFITNPDVPQKQSGWC